MLVVLLLAQALALRDALGERHVPCPDHPGELRHVGDADPAHPAHSSEDGHDHDGGQPGHGPGEDRHCAVVDFFRDGDATAVVLAAPQAPVAPALATVGLREGRALDGCGRFRLAPKGSPPAGG